MVFRIRHISGTLWVNCKDVSGKLENSVNFEFIYSLPRVYQKYAECRKPWSNWWEHPKYTSSAHFDPIILVYFGFYWLGKLWSNCWVNCKRNFKWATQVNLRYFLWENSWFTHAFPIWDILVTWPGKLWMYWLFSLNEPLRQITSTFFGKIQDLPMVYLIRKPWSHDWENCECTEHFLS